MKESSLLANKINHQRCFEIFMIPTMFAPVSRLIAQLNVPVLLLTVGLPILGANRSGTFADDWPQWNGPTRDGVVHEAGLLADIPEEGLKSLWKQAVGFGYSGPVSVDGRVYVTDYLKTSGEITNNPGKRDKLTGRERILCFDANTGKPIWQHAYDRPYAVSYPAGPRATPTVHQGRIYALGSEGDLLCLDTQTGEVLWRKQFTDDYNAKTPLWGHAASPLVYKDTLICMVGGPGSLVMAFDLKTGTERWTGLSSKETGYCSPSIVHRGGADQLLIWDPGRLSSLNAANGELYWQHDLKPGYGMSVLPPVVDGDMLYASGENQVSVMLKLSSEKPAADVLWPGNPKEGVYVATSSSIFDNGHIYGADIRSGALVCAQATDGKRLWQTAGPTTGGTRGRGAAHGSAFLLKVDKRYLIFSETGNFISATLSPEGYRETGRFHAIEPTGKAMGRDYVWTFPAVADQKLFLRNDKELACYSLSDD